jgi:hypothetical protein
MKTPCAGMTRGTTRRRRTNPPSLPEESGRSSPCLPIRRPPVRLVARNQVRRLPRARAARSWRRLQPLATPKRPLDLPPPRDSRFGSPLTLSRVHWVRGELVAEVKYLTWTEDNLLRQVVYEGLREGRRRLRFATPIHIRSPWRRRPARSYLAHTSQPGRKTTRCLVNLMLASSVVGFRAATANRGGLNDVRGT